MSGTAQCTTMPPLAAAMDSSTPATTTLETAAAEVPSSCRTHSGADAGTSSRSSIRRVASSPAFKGLQHTSTSGSGSSVRTRAGTAADVALEVYVVARAFAEFGGPVLKRLPPEMRTSLVDVGVCHYMTVFKTPSGELVQFDFGPRGGDVQKTAPRPLRALLARTNANTTANGTSGSASSSSFIGASASKGNSRGLPVASMALGSCAAGMPSSSGSSSGRLANAAGMSSSSSCAALAGMMAAQEAADAAAAGETRQALPIAGEVREAVLEELPAAHLYVGRCPLTIDDIRSWNSSVACKEYRLHTNDCRHYVNSLVQYATGLEASTQHLKRHHFKTRNSGRFLWHGWFVEAGQLLTDVGNWHRFQVGTAAAALLVTGRSTMAHLKPLLLPLSPLVTSVPALLPAAKAQLLKRPLASGAVAAAGGAAVAIRNERRRDGAMIDNGTQRSSNSNRFAMSMRGAALALRRAALGRRAGGYGGETAVTAVERVTVLDAAVEDGSRGAAAVETRAGAAVGGGNGLGVQMGRHVMWLTSGAARATGAFATAAGRRMGAMLQRQPGRSSPFDAAGATARGCSNNGSSEFGEFSFKAGGAAGGEAGVRLNLSGAGGRQVLRLPAPRLAWVRNRASASLVMH